MDRLIYLILVGPFWLLWKIVILLWAFIFKPFNESLADTRADKKQREIDEASAAARERRAADRQKQLDALKAALPKTLSESLRATIQINQITSVQKEQRRIGNWIADDKLVYVDGEERTEYSVDMILELTEQERGVIKQHGLENYLVEDDPLYSQEELEQVIREREEYLATFKDPGVAEILAGANKDILKERKAARRQVKLGDYLVAPYSKTFPNMRDANQYVARLKTKILPEIKKLIETYKDGSGVETIQL